MRTQVRTKPDETRARIVETADTLFRRLGFAKTAVADIAAELGMSPANVYRFFPSKTAIVQAICQRCLSQVEEAAWAIARSKVPAAERPCPKCGAERTCIGHEITEVIELIPAEVVVRRDIVEKLRCKPCDGELVRAETGDKVVVGGKLGPGLVAQLLVDKYDDGLPLHRQKQRFERMVSRLRRIRQSLPDVIALWPEARV